jgi:hypothetical protein
MRPTPGRKLQRKTFWALCVLQLVSTGMVLAQAVDVEVVPPTRAQELLKALIPQNKKFVLVNAYVAGANVKDVNLGLRCSSSSSGSTSGTVDDDGNIKARTQTDGATSCSERHEHYNTLVLGFADSSDSHASYLITTQCVEKWGWNHCDMPPEKSLYPIVLEIGKHGSFNIYAATSQKLGGKQKVAKFVVLDVSHVKQKDAISQTSKSEEKQN